MINVNNIDSCQLAIRLFMAFSNAHSLAYLGHCDHICSEEVLHFTIQPNTMKSVGNVGSTLVDHKNI